MEISVVSMTDFGLVQYKMTNNKPNVYLLRVKCLIKNTAWFLGQLYFINSFTSILQNKALCSCDILLFVLSTNHLNIEWATYCWVNVSESNISQYLAWLWFFMYIGNPHFSFRLALPFPNKSTQLNIIFIFLFNPWHWLTTAINVVPQSCSAVLSFILQLWGVIALHRGPC